jgi:hypothetical protein
MAINFKQQVTAEYFAEAIKREAITGAGAAVVTTATVAFQGDAVVVTLNGGDASSAGSAVIGFVGQRGAVTTTDPGFYALPGYGTVTQPIYTTGVAVVVTEQGAAGDFPFTVGYPTFNAIMADLARRGLKIEHFVTANATAPSTVDFATYTITNGVSALTGATKQANFEPNPAWALSDRV